MQLRANTDVFNPLVTKSSISFTNWIIKVGSKLDWRIFIFCTLGTNGLNFPWVSFLTGRQWNLMSCNKFELLIWIVHQLSLSSFRTKQTKAKGWSLVSRELRDGHFGVLRFFSVVPKVQSWALEVFFNFYNNKKWFFCIVYQVNNLAKKVLLKTPTPIQINLITKAKGHFLLLKKCKNTSVQLCQMLLSGQSCYGNNLPLGQALWNIFTLVILTK